MAPVEKRLTMSAAGIDLVERHRLAAGLLGQLDPEQAANGLRPRRLAVDLRGIVLEASPTSPVRTACCKVATASGDQIWASPRMRNMYSPPTSSALRSTGSSPKPSVWRLTVSRGDLVQPDALDQGRGAGEVLARTKSDFRPMASKICAPQ